MAIGSTPYVPSMVAVVLILGIWYFPQQSYPEAPERSHGWPQSHPFLFQAVTSLATQELTRKIIKQAFLALECCLISIPCQALLSDWIRADQGPAKRMMRDSNPMSTSQLHPKPTTTNGTVRNRKHRRSFAIYRQWNFLSRSMSTVCQECCYTYRKLSSHRN